MIKRRPKQDFNINYLTILDSELSKAQKDILIEVLGHHKKNCKYEYKPLYNSAIFKKLEFGKDSFTKHRETLVDDKYLVLKRVRTGRVILIQYHFNWTKLLKKQFITPIEQSEYKPKFINKGKQVLKKGHSLTIEDIPKLKADTVYKIKRYRLDNDGNRKGNGTVIKPYGKDLKSMILINHRTKEVEYIIGN